MTSSLIYQALTDPESLARKVSTANLSFLSDYQLAWAYYDRKMFSSEVDWSAYLARLELYKHTRLLFNPVPNIVDFYVDNVWRRADNETYPSLVTPIADGADETVFEAVAELDRWSNWWREQQEVKAYTAATSKVLVEAIDDPEREKITQKTVWAGFLTEIILNDAGDVQSYTVEYNVTDGADSYRFKKIVDKETYRYFKNDKPYDYPGKKSVMENFFGFCPAVLFHHSGNADNPKAAFSDYTKVNHTNSLASDLHDNIHQEIHSGKVIGLDDPTSIQVLTGGYKNKDGTINENDPRLDRVLLAAKGNVSVHDLSGLLKLAEAHPYLEELLLSFGSDYPELEYRQIIKENSQLSGIALERLLTPAQNRLDRAAPNYDGQLIKLRQMQTAMGGARYNNENGIGRWTTRTPQQEKFAPFGLKSYEKGLLDFNLKRSLLIEPSEDEREDLLKKKADRAAVMKDFVDEREVLLIADYTEEEADEILTRREQARNRAQIESGQPALSGGQPVMQLGDGMPMNE